MTTNRLRGVLAPLSMAAVLFGLGVAPSCGGDKGGVEDAEAPGYGKEDSGDAADLECRIVLRSLAMSEDGTKAIGLLDAEAAEVDAGGKPNVLFTFEIGANDGAKFFQLDPKTLKEVAGGLEGYQRFQFEIDVAGKEAVELIPFLGTKTGRFFDHNRDADGVAGVRPDRRPGAKPLIDHLTERGVIS